MVRVSLTSAAHSKETHPQFLKQVKNAEKEIQDKVSFLEKWRDCHVRNCELVSLAGKKGCSDDYEVDCT